MNETGADAAVDGAADIRSRLDALTDLVRLARSMPMSGSCVLNRSEVLALLDEVRALLPGEITEARWLLADRDEVIEEGRREAASIVEAGRAEQARLVSEVEVAGIARGQVDRVAAEAEREAARLRAEVDDYVDAKLANFEVVLLKTLAAVERGRDKLRGQSDLDALADGPDGTLLE